MKQSEAKILIFLENADKRFCFARMMGIKLKMDYAYLLARLADLKNSQFIRAIRRDNKVFYELTGKANLEEAKKLI